MGSEVANGQEIIHQIEYRWDDRRDLSPVASTMSQVSLRAWDSWIRGWVRHPHADRLWQSFCYQVQPNGRAALAWRYDWQAAEREDGSRGRPLVSRVLVGMESLLTPEVAIALCHTGLPTAAGPRPGQVTARTGLSAVSAAELSDLVRERAAKLDMEAAQQEGLRQVIAAALANPHIPLAIIIRDPHILRAPEEGLQWRLLWGLRRIVSPVLGTTRRGWSFSTFEPPLGDVDPATLPDILFRQAQEAPVAAPARPREEVKIRPLDPAALDDGSNYTEMARWLVEEYKVLGGDELKRLIAEWSSGENSLDQQLYRVYDGLRNRQSPVTVSSPAPSVSLSPDRVSAREPAPQPAMAESRESALVEPTDLAPPDGSLPEDEAAPLHQAPSAPDEDSMVAQGLARTAAVDDSGAQSPAPADLVPEGPDPEGRQDGSTLQSPALASDQAVLRRQAKALDQALCLPVVAPEKQAHEQQTEDPPATGRDPAQASEREQSGVWDRARGQEPHLPDPAGHTDASRHLGGQHGDTAQEDEADPHGPGAPNHPAGPRDVADPERGGGLLDDLLGPVPKEASPPPQWGVNEQASAGRPQTQVPAPRADTIDQLLKMLPAAATEREFWITLLTIRGLDTPSESDCVKARRKVLEPEWYDQISPRFGHLLGVNALSEIFQKIIIPDLDNPIVIEMIAQRAVDWKPAMIGGLLVAARQTSDEVWQFMMGILQPGLAYRWTTEKLEDTLWNLAIAPHLEGDLGRGRRGRRRRK